MAHNEGKLTKRVSYVGLAQQGSIRYFDQSIYSNNYFNIVELPTRLTSGKNVIKFNAGASALVDKSRIHIEILDYNGNPVYYEPLNYSEKDGTRVLTVYVYPKTAPGPCTIYFAGRVRKHPQTGKLIPYSNNPGNSLYKDIPNLLWSRKVNIAPEKSNSSEIIFTTNPRVTITERVVPYKKPINLSDVNLIKSSSMFSNSSVLIEGIPDSNNNSANEHLNGPAGEIAFEGDAEGASPNASLGFSPNGQVVSPPTLFVSYGSSNTTSADAMDNYSTATTTNNNFVTTTDAMAPGELAKGPSSVSSPGYSIIQGYSRLKTTNFPLSASMEGGYLKIQNPKVKAKIHSQLNADGNLFYKTPKSEAVDALVGANDTIVPVKGSATFRILQVCKWQVCKLNCSISTTN